MNDSLLPLLLVAGARDALRSAAADLSLIAATTDDEWLAVAPSSLATRSTRRRARSTPRSGVTSTVEE
jgi:hypothetical protein